MNTQPNPFTVEELEQMLCDAKKQASDEARAKRESVVPQYTYSVLPVDDKFERIYDPSVAYYRVEGTCQNQAEIDAVGGKSFTGGMNYLFNSASGSIIGAFGGGTIHIGGKGFSRVSPEVDVTIARVSAFIVANPEGGDITSIIEDHNASIA